MAAEFDPYYTWLGIPPEEQPPDHYRLLSIRRFESSAEVISNASDRAMSHLRTLSAGKRAADAQRLLNEISAATRALLEAPKKQAYDAQLKAKVAAEEKATARRSIPVAQAIAEVPVAAVLPVSVGPPTAPIYSAPMAPPTSAAPNLQESGGFVAVVARPSPRTQATKSALPVGVLIGGAVAVLVLFAGVGYIAFGRGSSEEAANNKPDQVVKPTPPVTPTPVEPVKIGGNDTTNNNTKPTPKPIPTTPVAQDTRTAWSFTTSPENASGLIRHMGGKDWEEVRSDNQIFRFVEESRTPESITLKEQARGIVIRLFDDHLEFQQGTPDWRRAQPGAWVTTKPRVINLLSGFNQGLKVSGEFVQDGAAWVASANARNMLELPLEPTGEYTLQATVKRREGNHHALIFVCPLNGKQFDVGFDSEPQSGFLTGLERWEGKRVADPDNATLVRGSLLKTDQEHVIEIEVRTTRVQVKLDGKTIIDRRVTGSELSTEVPNSTPHPRRIGVGTWFGARYEISKLMLTIHPGSEQIAALKAKSPTTPVSTNPPTTKPSDVDVVAGKAVDYLDKYLLSQCKVEGDVEIDNSTWKIHGGDDYSFLTTPPQLSGDYLLEMKFRRTEGSDTPIEIALPIRERHVLLKLNAFPERGYYSGFELKEPLGMPGAFPARRGSLFQRDQEVNLKVAVTGDRVVADVNGKQLPSWSGAPSGLPDKHDGHLDFAKLTIGSQGATYEITKLSVSPILKHNLGSVASTEPMPKPEMEPATPSTSTNTSPTKSTDDFMLGFTPGDKATFTSNTPVFEIGKPFTLQFWMRNKADWGPPCALARIGDLNLVITAPERNGATSYVLNYGSRGSGSGAQLATLGADWHHWAIAYDGEQLEAFLDGKRELRTRPDGFGIRELSPVSLGIAETPGLPGTLRGEIRGISLDTKAHLYQGKANFDVPKSPGFKLPVGVSLSIDGAKALDAQGRPSRISLADMLNSSIPEADKLAPPDDETLKAARAKVTELYKTAIKDATKPEQKAKLAKTMLSVATSEKDPTMSYAVFSEARTLAVAGMNVETVIEVINEVDRRYKIDRLSAMAKLLPDLNGKGLLPEQREILVQEAMAGTSAALRTDRIDEADALSIAANAGAIKGKDPERKKLAKTLRDYVVDVKASWEVAETALRKLSASPDDPAANLAAGRYYSFAGSDFAKGLPYLVKGNDNAIATAAKLEQEATTDEAKLAAADAWFALIPKLKPIERIGVQRRVLGVYQEQLPQLSGVAKDSVEKKLPELEAALAEIEKSMPSAEGMKSSKPIPGLIVRVLAGDTVNSVPTPFLAVLEQDQDAYRLNIEQRLQRYPTRNSRLAVSGIVVVEKDMEVTLNFARCTVQLGTQSFDARSGREVQTVVPMKKGTYPIRINANYPGGQFRVNRADTGESLLHYTEHDLQTEMNRAVPVPSGGTAKGERINLER